MTVLKTSFELGAPGTDIPTTGSAGDGDAFTAPGNTQAATAIAENSIAAALASGSLYAKISFGATVNAAWRGWNVNTSVLNFRWYVYLTAYPPANWDFLQVVKTTGGTSTIARVRMSPTGQLAHVNGSSQGTFTSGVVPLNTLVRIEASWNFATGTFSVDAYPGHGTTPIANTSVSLTGLTFGFTLAEQVRVGFPLLGFANYILRTDAWAVSDTGGRLGPVVVSSAGAGKLRIGGAAPSALRVGSAAISKAYLGSSQVWP